MTSLHRQDLTEAAGPHQFAAMMPDGARCVASHLRAQTSPDQQTRVFVRTDIRNAFNEIDRQHVLASLESANPLLAAFQLCWLHRPTTAFMHANEGTRRILHTNVGIPQGDPFSSLAFAVAMGPPLQKMHAEGHQPFAYADDTVLASEPGRVHDALRAWQRHLQAIGLTLNHSKLQVWDPGDQGLPAELYAAYPAISVSTAGFVMCGLPIDSPESAAADQAGPWGTADFVRDSFSKLVSPLPRDCAP